MAPTIGAVMYSHASPKLPAATIGPTARAGLKAAPVRAPPMMMLSVSVIPIASGARLPARPATAVLSTTVTRKKPSKASIMKPASGVTVMVVVPESEAVRECGQTKARGGPAQNGPQQQRAGDAADELADDVANRLANAHRAGGEHADRDSGIHVPARHGAVGEGEGHDGEPWAKAIAAIPGRPTPLPTTAAAPAPMNTKAKVPMNSARSFGAIRLDIVDSRDEIDRLARSGLRRGTMRWFWGWPTARQSAVGRRSEWPYSAATICGLKSMPSALATPVP